MKIKVSDLFEEPIAATDNIPILGDAMADTERIKKLVLKKLRDEGSVGTGANSAGRPKRTSRKYLIGIAVVAALMTSAFAANAATEGKLFGAILLNDDNRYLAKKPSYASYEEVAPGEQPKAGISRIASSTIIQKSQLTSDSIKGSSITNVPVKQKGDRYRIPEILTNNGDIVIFTKSGDAGWHLEKGESLTVTYSLDLKTNPFSDAEGENMEVGYIRNGELIPGYSDKAKEFTLAITADVAGEYFFYIRNYSAGHIIISEGTIR